MTTHVFLLFLLFCGRVGATPRIRIGTRGSPLALRQAQQTAALLRKHWPSLKEEDVFIQRINTQGDSVLNRQLSEIGGKGLFTKELDKALLNNEVDICVHSMKDVPTTLAPGTVLPCNLEREDTNDVFISRKYKSLKDIPNNSVIGTSSLRRKAQVLAMNPTLKVVLFRGNVQTRLRKIDSGQCLHCFVFFFTLWCTGDVDGTLLALAGLKRLGMTEVVEQSQCVPPELMLPAVAQGAIGIQCRADDTNMLKYLKKLNHPDTKTCVDCERAFLKSLDGNCRTPIAGQAKICADGKLHFKGFLAKTDGSESVFVEQSGEPIDSIAIGEAAAEEIKAHLGPQKFKEYQSSFSESI